MIGKEIEVERLVLVNVRKRYKKFKAKVVGAYYSEYWHPYIYKAFHVIYEDGTKDTVWAHNYKPTTEEYSRY